MYIHIYVYVAYIQINVYIYIYIMHGYAHTTYMYVHIKYDVYIYTYIYIYMIYPTVQKHVSDVSFPNLQGAVVKRSGVVMAPRGPAARSAAQSVHVFFRRDGRVMPSMVMMRIFNGFSNH